jgi:hypothetical protein
MGQNKSSKKKPTLRTIDGQPSYRLASRDVELFVTRVGGHMGPAVFDRQNKKIRPFSVAPWAKETLPPGTPPIIKVLRGDFFCMPFGGNDTSYRGEQHPIHGETANRTWTCRSLTREAGETSLNLSLSTRARKGRVDKTLRLVDGHQAIYTRHVISGMSGPMNLGHHAMLKFPDRPGSGRVSTSRMVHGQVCSVPAEDPAMGGYSSLEPGAEFTSLSRVPMSTGKNTDLSRFPARRGFEDIVTTVADDRDLFAWTAVTFPEERYVWFALKDPRVLRQTVFWISNGGRHYAPWNGRHIAVMGLEEVTSYFHFGLAESAKRNPLSARGYPTCHRLDPDHPLAVNYIMAVATIPRGFDRVKTIRADSNRGVILTSTGGKTVKVPLDLGFLG